MGTLFAGHYVACVRYGGSWVMMNDSTLALMNFPPAVSNADIWEPRAMNERTHFVVYERVDKLDEVELGFAQPEDPAPTSPPPSSSSNSSLDAAASPALSSPPAPALSPDSNSSSTPVSPFGVPATPATTAPQAPLEDPTPSENQKTQDTSSLATSVPASPSQPGQKSSEIPATSTTAVLVPNSTSVPQEEAEEDTIVEIIDAESRAPIAVAFVNSATQLADVREQIVSHPDWKLASDFAFNQATNENVSWKDFAVFVDGDAPQILIVRSHCFFVFTCQKSECYLSIS